ncbi:MAG: bifunctional folylpolyglutamate synthase/dihydrofolate synthase [bacterium]
MNPEKFLYSLVNYERVPGYKYDLEAYKMFLEKLGSPHKRLRNVILIAGTKGKGSTATIICSCLVASGYRVGLFTSPHLIKVTERIKINNREITQNEMEKYIKAIRPHINFHSRIGARTFFEVLTTIAFMYFAEQEVDFAILEVGLGGRLDATNVFDFHIPVITRIGYDHMNLLGSRISQIAYEKAGIIHGLHSSTYDTNKKIVITIHQRPTVESILKKISCQRNHEIIYADDLHQIEIIESTAFGSKLSIKGALGSFVAFLPLVGRHQIENLKIVLAVLNILKEKGYKINKLDIRKGIARTKLPGRFEIISKKPLTIYDVAHNEDSFKALHLNILKLKHLQKNFTDYSLYMIFGCNQDKDIGYAIKNILPMAKQSLLVKINTPRAMEPLDIYDMAKKYQRNILIAGSVKRALEYIHTIKNERLIIIIFGSFYLYSDIYSFYHSNFADDSF